MGVGKENLHLDLGAGKSRCGNSRFNQRGTFDIFLTGMYSFPVGMHSYRARSDPGGGTPLYGLYGDVPLDRAWILASLS